MSDISSLQGINSNNTLSLAYSFVGLLFIDRFRTQGIENYFRIRSFDIPQYKIIEPKDVKFIGGIPVNHLTGDFTWDTLKLEMFLSSDYFEYLYMKQWMDELREKREYVHQWVDDDGTKLITNISVFILNSKEDKISMGLRFKNAFPLTLNSLKYEKQIEPLLFNMEFKFSNVETIPKESFANIIL